MTNSRKREGRKSAGGGVTHVFRLFVAGREPNSAQARVNLARLCEEHVKGRYRIETFDVLKDAAAAYENHVLVTPTLILVKPGPKVTVYGNLSEARQVLSALRLIGDGR